jgi:hypothetical protein
VEAVFADVECSTGDRLEFIESERGFLVVAANRDIRALEGIVSRLTKPVTIEAMNRVIQKMGRMRSNRRSARA